MAVLGANSRAACFSHFHSFSLTPLRNELPSTIGTSKKKDAARESALRMAIEDSLARAYGS